MYSNKSYIRKLEIEEKRILIIIRPIMLKEIVTGNIIQTYRTVKYCWQRFTPVFYNLYIQHVLHACHTDFSSSGVSVVSCNVISC